MTIKRLDPVDLADAYQQGVCYNGRGTGAHIAGLRNVQEAVLTAQIVEGNMSTDEVPGANPANRDMLAMGCWAEHEDGSLILVKGVEAKVVYEIYDVAVQPPVSYTDAMNESDFKKQFSWQPKDGKTKDRWTWHDKTPFPWSRVMAAFADRPRPGYAAAEDQISAAARVAESLNLRGQRVREESIKHNTEEVRPRSHEIIDRMASALKDMFNG